MNTFNYLLSDFLGSDRSATYGPDYYVVGKQLMVPLSSTWMANVTAITTVNSSLCTLDLSRAPRLSAISINDTNLVNFVPPTTNTTFLCAFNLKSYNISLTGSQYNNITLINCPELRSLDLRFARNVNVLRVLNCQKLSSVELQLETFNAKVSNIFVDFFGNNLTNTAVNNVYGAFLSGYYFENKFYNSYLSICNPVTGTFSNYLTVSGLNGLNVNLSICSLTPGVNTDLLFATKI